MHTTIIIITDSDIVSSDEDEIKGDKNGIILGIIIYMTNTVLNNCLMCILLYVHANVYFFTRNLNTRF